MDGWICSILKLLWNKCISIFLLQTLCLGDCALHAIASRCQDDFCSKCTYDLPTLHTHRIRHRQNQMQSLCRTYKCKTDSGVTACRLNNDRILIDLAILDSLLDHRICNTVLHTSKWVEVLKLDYDLCLQVLLLLVICKLQKRSISNQFG